MAEKLSAPGDYEKSWNTIDSLEQQGLYKSALEATEQLYAQAKKDNKGAQVIKTLLFRGKYTTMLDDDGFVKAVGQFETELQSATQPEKAVLQSMLGELYATYLSNQSWKIRQRTPLAAGEGGDILTWSAEQIERKAFENYTASLQPEDLLRQTPVDYVAAISNPGQSDTVGVPLRPWLYDLLAHRALEHFNNERNFLTEPVYKFYLDSPKAFEPAAAFVKANFPTRDSSSAKWQSIGIYQKVLAFHLADRDPAAAIDADLLRLTFALNNSTLTDKGIRYEEALLSLHKMHYDHASDAEILYQLASYYAGEYAPDGNKSDSRKRAVAQCEDAISRHPNSFGAVNCQALMVELRRPSLSVQTESCNLPAENLLARLDYKNLKTVWAKVVKGVNDPRVWSELGYDEQLPYLNQRPIVQSKQLALPDPADFGEHSTEFGLEPLPVGQYFVLVSDNSTFDSQKGIVSFADFTVSRLAAVTFNESGVPNLLTMDRQTGSPIAGVKADFFERKWVRNRTEYQRTLSVNSDGNGTISPKFSENGAFFTCLSKDGDTLWLGGALGNYRYKNQPHTYNAAQFFTDRSIYRPGQTVYFKAVLMQVDEKQMPKILPNEAVKVRFFDVNGQEKSMLNLRSNAYGTVNGAFTAPSSGLTGNMSIQVEGYTGAASFSVEEYKRPKFEVTFQPVEGAFKLGEKIAMKGEAKNYAGSNVDGAQVRYRVVREARFPYWGWWGYGRIAPSSPSMEIANGESTTDAEGKFEVSFIAQPDLDVPEKDKPIFSYTVYVDVTDISGETRSGESSIQVGYVALELKVGIGAAMHLDSLKKVSVRSTNLAGQKQAAQVEVSMQRLVAPKQFYRNRYWAMPDQWMLSESQFKQQLPHYAWKNAEDPLKWDREDRSLSFSINTGTAEYLDMHNGLSAGYYLMHVSSKDAYGKVVEFDQIVRIWDKKNPQYRFNTPQMLADRNVAQPGEKLTLEFGGPVEGLQHWFATGRGGEVQAGKWVRSGNESLQVEERDRGGLSTNSVCVWNNRIFINNTLEVAVPWSNKDLEIKLESFRNKLAPGQKEEWRLHISGPGKEKAAAELVAAMYDASLDQFRPHGWAGIGFPSNRPPFNWINNGQFEVAGGFVFLQYTEGANYNYRSYRSLNWFDFPLYGGRAYPMAAMMRVNKAMPVEEDRVMAMDASVPGTSSIDGADVNERGGRFVPSVVKSDELAAPKDEAFSPSTLRTNLNETVFFFPELHTDANGDVILKFTMNEALTRWKLLLFAHTTDLKNGLATQEVVTQKDLMVIVNAPRFLRAGDEMEFAAKLSNLTDQAIAGTASLALLNAETLQPVEAAFGMTTQSRQQAFSVNGGQSAPLRWSFKVPSDYTGAITWQVFAEGKTVRDGEESTIPVVSNRMLVTETLPITVRGNQSKTFVFDNIKNNNSSTLTTERYTLEFTSNPVWYAVQALPYMMEYPFECSEQVFSRLYANTLAQSVTEKMPNIRRVYDRWKGTSALQSNLSKNQELKSALLEETPWVLEAQSEEQQKQNIALLFDLNRMADERSRAIQTLAERQSASGGWPWFPGGRDSWYITQYILSGFGHLDKLGALRTESDPKVGVMVGKALDFCDGEADQQYRELEKQVQKGQTTLEADHLDGMIIQYLYAKSFFKIDKPDKVTAYYLGQAEKHWLGKGLFQEGMLALVLHRFGREATAQKIVNSLRERAQVKEELGMYWPFDWGYYWYQLPVETQALMVEVFDEVANDQAAVENLRIWLLKNKQTNRWESTKATSEAVYALLLHGDNWLNNTKPVQVSMGNKVLKPAEVEAGTGYFKQSWSGTEVKNSWAEIKVDNPNSNIVWGAAYWQYFEDLDKITDFKKTPLTVVKTLYREENSPTGPKLVPLQSGDGLQVGDKLKVRIELRVDRAMEFVHLKDMRAAGFEPVNVLSGYRWQGGLGYYESTRDLATHFFIDYLPRGTFVLEYPMVVSHRGNMSNGITTLQCMYAPEFSSHSEGIRVRVK